MYNSIPDLLKNGGYILFARHGEATEGEDKPNPDFTNCLSQRNLSALGRKQAASYGEVLRNLRIPIHFPILTSPFCRTIETAQLAFPGENILIEPFFYEIYKLNNTLPDLEKQNILTTLQSLLEIKPPYGQNRVIIDHSFPKEIGLGPIPNMGTVIIQPHGRGNGYDIVGRITLEDLTNVKVTTNQVAQFGKTNEAKDWFTC